MIVAVIGGGKIGDAVARRVALSTRVSQVIMTRKSAPENQATLAKNLVMTRDNSSAAAKASVVILAVKAGDAKGVLEEISGSTSDKLVISLMAAISIKRLERELPGAKIVRAMPNIAAKIGEAITAYAPSAGLGEKEISTVELILSCFGDCVQVSESLMDAVTALSGSGPAYIAVLIDALVTAGLKVGLPRDIALKLAIKTLTGTANMLAHTTMHPAELRDTVTTPAGTTIAGIYELEKGSFRTSIINAVEAATYAAERVAKKFESE